MSVRRHLFLLYTKPMSKKGLSSAEARARLQQYGANAIASGPRFSAVFVFLGTFKNPLVLLLLASSAIAAFFGEKQSFVIILLIVLLTSVIDFFNSYRSDKAAQKLKDRVKVCAHVFRDGKLEEIPMTQVVPGDWVSLMAGDLLPADSVVLEAEHCFINESSLTGESFPQAKGVGSTCFMGSSVASGRAIVEVQKTGSGTQYAKVVEALAAHHMPTEFDREIRSFSKLVLKITLSLVIFVFVVNAFLKQDILGSLLFAVALAVGITPELLPMIITLNLSKGSMAMAKKGVIVKHLSALQNFGSMDVLCTDKTGTLTDDKIALVKYVNIHGKENDEVLREGYLNSSFTTGFNNPLDDAVKEFEHLSVKGITKLDEIPYDFDRKRESIIVKEDDSIRLIAKGSVEQIFDICSNAKGDALHAARETYQKLSRGGFRVLAVAHKTLEEKKAYSAADETHMRLLGFLAFLDPPKEGVEKTLEAIQSYGITIKIITGDNELISRRIAQEINFPVHQVTTGAQIKDMSPAELKKVVEKTTIFAQVNPEQKMQIIRALQHAGHVVGYMGDGINDAPSLRAADVGISVNNAVDIAKESADLILLHKSLAQLIDGVIEGRKTFVNTLKYLMMVLSSNFGNVFSMAGSSVLLSFLPMLPPQILLNNLLYDSSQFAIPLDRVDVEELQKPRTLSIKQLRRFLFIFGPVSSIFDFLTFGLLLLVFGLSISQFQAGWFIESMATQVLVVYIIRTRKIPFLQSSPSLALVVATLAAVAIAWVVALSPIGQFFGFTPIPWLVVAMISVIVVIYLLVVQGVKGWFFQRFGTM